MTTLRSGAAYAVSCADASLRLTCAAGAIAASLARKLPVTLLAPAGTRIVEALAGHDVDALDGRRGRLRLLRLQAGSDRQLAAAGGGERLVAELEDFGVSSRGLLVILPGDSLLAVSAASIRPLRHWLRRTHSCLLMLCAAPAPATADLNLELDGIGEIDIAAGDLRWLTRYWRQADGEMLSPEYPLRICAGGRGLELRRDLGDTPGDVQALRATDEERIVATHDVVRGQRRVPSLWQLAPDLHAVEHALDGAVAATCILDMPSAERFRDVAECIHGLRRRLGSRLKIVVFAVGPGIRTSQERLLIGLGANAVVARGGFDRLLALLPTLQGQRYTRRLPADLGEAYLSGRTALEHGYLPTARFCEAVTDSARRVADLGLESVLIRLQPDVDTSPLAALRPLRLTRGGDIATADADGAIYVFLSACRERDADSVLERVFSGRLTELFSSQTRYPTNTAALIEAQRLAIRLSRRPAPDYSAQLPAASALAATAESAPIESTGPGRGAAPAGAAATVPRILMPAPLRLRATS